ncbi:MAG: NADH-quinone oxidoreductase subunit J [Desulfovibrio sp.]|nr:NADH-quinone oxidoreductase subunit J [Desulfovibrio sp.]
MPTSDALQTIAGIIFLVFVAATFFGAAVAVTTRRLIRSVAGLALCLLGVAGIYYYLSSPFLAFMQILIYIGAVCVTLVFAIMLAERSHRVQVAQKGPLVLALGTLGGSVFTATLLATTLTARWNDAPPTQADGSLERIGQSLLSTYSMSFELISVVLLVAMVGALVLAREGRDRQ